MLVARPAASTSTSRAHVSGQSCGQAPRTTRGVAVTVFSILHREGDYPPETPAFRAESYSCWVLRSEERGLVTDSLTAQRRRVPKVRVFVTAAIAAGLIAAAIPALKGSSPALGATPSCTPAATWPGTNDAFAQQVVALVNQHRASMGLVALTVNATLTDSAVWKSRHMAAYAYFDHNDPAPPIARDPFTRMLNCGYSSGGSLGENIAVGQPTPSDVMTAWLNSPGHRANIEAPAFRSTGVGVAVGGPYGIYWTQEFASGVSSGTPPPAPPPAPPPPPASPPPPPASPPPPPATPPPPPSPPRPPAPPPASPVLPPDRGPPSGNLDSPPPAEDGTAIGRAGSPPAAVVSAKAATNGTASSDKAKAVKKAKAAKNRRAAKKRHAAKKKRAHRRMTGTLKAFLPHAGKPYAVHMAFGRVPVSTSTLHVGCRARVGRKHLKSSGDIAGHHATCNW